MRLICTSNFFFPDDEDNSGHRHSPWPSSIAKKGAQQELPAGDDDLNLMELRERALIRSSPDGTAGLGSLTHRKQFPGIAERFNVRYFVLCLASLRNNAWEAALEFAIARALTVKRFARSGWPQCLACALRRLFTRRRPTRPR